MPRKRPEVPQMKGVEGLFSVEVDQPVSTVSVAQIHLPQKQPRRYFDPEKLAQLVQSIAAHGILEPLLVRPLAAGGYELVAGERRLRAARELKLAEVPIVVKELTDQAALQIALVENLQREDLNPIEETEALLDLMALVLEVERESVISLLNQVANAKKREQVLTDNVIRQFETVESIVQSVGRGTVESFRVNRLPLLNLPPDVLEALQQGRLEFTKARAIAQLKESDTRLSVLQAAITEGLSLVEIRQRIQAVQTQASHMQKTEKQQFSERLSTISRQFKQAKIWTDSKKRQRAERLLSQLEQLVQDQQENIDKSSEQ